MPFRVQPNGAAATRLPAVSPWTELSDEAAAMVLTLGRAQKLERGQAPTERAGLVLRGVLSFADQTADGRQTLSQMLHIGDVFDLRDEDGPCAPPQSLTPATVLTFRTQELEDCLVRRVDLLRAWSARLRAQLARLRRHVSHIAFKTPLERLASVLLEYRKLPGLDPAQSDGERLRLVIQRSDISEHIGVKPETISRAFRQLELERMIAIEERDVVRLLDLPGLERMANGGRPRASTKPTSNNGD